MPPRPTSRFPNIIIPEKDDTFIDSPIEEKRPSPGRSPSSFLATVTRISRVFSPSKNPKSPKSPKESRSDSTWSSTTRVDSPQEQSFDSPSVKKEGKKSTPAWKRNVADTVEGALLMSLEILGKAPFPGIEMVTIGLRETMSRATQLAYNETAIKDLTRRLTQLRMITDEMDPALQEKPLFKHHGQRVTDTIATLAEEIFRHNNRGTTSKFFSSMGDSDSLNVHLKTLDSLAVDLTAAIGNETHKSVKEILENQKQQQQQVRQKPHPRATQSYDISNAVIKVDGDLFSGNSGSVSYSLNGANIESSGQIGSNNNAWKDPPGGGYNTHYNAHYQGYNRYTQSPSRYNSVPLTNYHNYDEIHVEELGDATNARGQYLLSGAMYD